MQEFNKKILETMQKEVNQIKSVYEVCEYCKEGNEIADKEYIKHFPSHKDLLSIFKQSVSILENNITGDYNDYIVENTLNDIEFIIGQNVLMESHVQRLMLSIVTLQDLPIFRRKTEDIKDTINNLYNCNLSRFNYKYNEEKAKNQFSYQQLESYMRYNKIGYEEDLINSEINGDYVQEAFEFNLDLNGVKSLDNKVKEKYKCIESINIIDKFKLEQKGIKPIVEYKGQFIHCINGKQYNVYKQGCYYYMISESLKSYRVDINSKRM